jgi:hypothetical protein
MQFSEIYFKPFRGDPGGYSLYIWCGRNTLCFNLLRPALRDRIIALLNGEDNAKPFRYVDVDDDYILINGAPALLVRGWGRLTGGGALQLKEADAIKLQKDFLEWSIKQLKKDE